MEKVEWYNSAFPKECEYNDPGCDMRVLSVGSHEDVDDQLRVHELVRSRIAASVDSMVDLSGIGITDTDLVWMLKSLTTFQSIDFSRNRIGDAGIAVITKHLLRVKVEKVDLSDNLFGVIGQSQLDGVKIIRGVKILF